jgi:hypothetical protein
VKTKGKKRAHPGKGPLGHIRCDHCKKPLLVAAAVGFQNQKIHAGCFGEVLASTVGNVKKIFGGR